MKTRKQTNISFDISDKYIMILYNELFINAFMSEVDTNRSVFFLVISLCFSVLRCCTFYYASLQISE